MPARIVCKTCPENDDYKKCVFFIQSGGELESMRSTHNTGIRAMSTFVCPGVRSRRDDAATVLRA